MDAVAGRDLQVNLQARPSFDDRFHNPKESDVSTCIRVSAYNSSGMTWLL